MDLLISNLDYRGLTPPMINPKPRQSVSVHPNNDFSVFTFNTSEIEYRKEVIN